MSRSRSLRASVVVLAAVFALAALSACGSSDGGEADVAKQDRIVERANQAQARYEANIKAALRKKWRARARERARLARARARVHRRAWAVVHSSGSMSGDLCAPIRRRFPGRAGRADQQARRQRRRQTLNYLNLSCSSRN
jgi:hypothetical protein